MHRRPVRLLIIIIGLGLIVNLSRDIIRLVESLNQVKRVEEQTREIETKRQALLNKKDYYQTEEFIEEEARNKLNMTKPGETIVILPENLKAALGQEETSQQNEESPNWKQWWELFF